jgi:hypothetical protein
MYRLQMFVGSRSAPDGLTTGNREKHCTALLAGQRERGLRFLRDAGEQAKAFVRFDIPIAYGKPQYIYGSGMPGNTTYRGMRPRSSGG